MSTFHSHVRTNSNISISLLYNSMDVMILLSILPFSWSYYCLQFKSILRVTSGMEKKWSRFFGPTKNGFEKKSLDMLNLQQNGLQTTLTHKCRRIINNTPSDLRSTALAHNVRVCECVFERRGGWSRNFNYWHSLKGSFWRWERKLYHNAYSNTKEKYT